MPLQIGKTPIVVPRQHQYNEHVNDHQVEFARNVAQRMGTIIPVEDINTLGDVITNYDQIVAGMGRERYTMYSTIAGAFVNLVANKGRYDAEKNAVIISLEKDEQSALSPQKCTT